MSEILPAFMVVIVFALGFITGLLADRRPFNRHHPRNPRHHNNPHRQPDTRTMPWE